MVSEDVVSVFREATIGQGQERLEVVAMGESSLTLTSSYDHMPEIGTWRHVLAPGVFNQLASRGRCGFVSRARQRCRRNGKTMNQTEAQSPVMAVSLVRSHPWIGLRSVRIVRDGESVFFRTQDFGQPSEIGVWMHAVPSSTFEDFVLRLDGLSRAVPDDGFMMPGQTVTTFEVTRAGEAEPSYLSIHPNQPELPEVLELLSTIEAELREYPSEVLRGEARWRNEVVSKDDLTLLDVTLSNPGSQQIQIENPAWEKAEGLSGLHLWGRAEEGGRMAIDVLAKDIQAIDAWAATPELLLAPGQRVSFVVRTSLSAVDPGRCTTGLDIRSDHTESATPEFLSGKLSIDLGTITVTE